GYRFVAAVREVKPHAIEAPDHRSVSAVQMDSREIEYTRAHIVVEDEFVHDTPPQPDRLAGAVSPSSALDRRRWQTMVGAALLLLVTAGLYWAWRTHNRVQTSNLHRIGVLPFKPLGSDSGNEML